VIHLVIQGLPPSANNAYFNLRGGGRTLATAGKKFKNETKAYLTRKYVQEMRKFVPNEPYLVYVRFYFKTLQNGTWGKAKGAESRYKKTDASNRIKLLEDVLKDVTGVDDSNTMALVLEKRLLVGPEEKTEVFIWNLDREESPFDAVLHSL
jgi:hypothetical protein